MRDETAIFQYRDPVTGTMLHADPIAIQRRLILHGGSELNGLLRNWQSPDRLAAASAEEQLMLAVRGAFGWPDINPETGEGVPDAVCKRVLREYLDFFGQCEPSSASTPT